MSKMAEIAMRLDDLEVLLYDKGLGDAEVQAEASLLCEIGFTDEVRALFYEFENMLYEGSEY
jgi:hypothetical protein